MRLLDESRKSLSQTSISTMRQRAVKALSKSDTFAISRQPHQIVGGGSEGEGPSDTITAAEAGLPLAGDCLDPAECFRDAAALADGIAAVPGRPPVAELWPLVFCATCGVRFIECSSLTKSLQRRIGRRQSCWSAGRMGRDHVQRGHR